MAYKPTAKSIKAVAAKKATGASFTTAKGSNFTQTGAQARPAGAALSGLRAARPPKTSSGHPTATPAKPTTTAAPAAPPPFLTPAEQVAWQKYQGAYADRIGNINPDTLAGASPDQVTQALINAGGTLGQSLAVGEAKYTSGLGNAQQSHDLSADNANQVMAARGLFQSSIRDADLNDIDATLATRQATLNTAWGALQTRIGSAFDTAVRDYGTTGSYYSGLGVQNAQASDTGLPGPSTGTSTTSGAAAAGSASTAQRPPVPTGPPIQQPKSSQPKPPKPQPVAKGATGASMTFGNGAAPATMTFGAGR